MVTALFRSLRETDYIRWYLEGRMVGGVLRVLGKILPPGLPDRLIELGNGVMPDIRHQG